MKLNTGFKVIDKLVEKHGLSLTSDTHNAFQLSLLVPDTSDVHTLGKHIASFKLDRFPNSIWIKLVSGEMQLPATIHRFSLPANNEIFCWLLVDASGELADVTVPSRKHKHVVSARSMAKALVNQSAHLNYQTAMIDPFVASNWSKSF